VPQLGKSLRRLGAVGEVADARGHVAQPEFDVLVGVANTSRKACVNGLLRPVPSAAISFDRVA